MGKKILAAITGIITAFVLVYVVEKIGHTVYPLPPDLDQTDMAALAEYVKIMPTGAFFFVLGAWIIGTFAGGLVACFIAKEKPMLYAGLIGGLMLVATIINLVMIPHPVWFSISGILGILIATFFAAKVAECKIVKKPAQ